MCREVELVFHNPGMYNCGKILFKYMVFFNQENLLFARFEKLDSFTNPTGVIICEK